MATETWGGSGNRPGPKGIYCEFRHGPNASGRLGTAATGSTGDVNMLVFGGHGKVPSVCLEHHVIVTQTILAPVIAAGGLDLGSQDQTDNDGFQLSAGITTGSSCNFKARTEACYAKFLDIVIADVSGTDDFCFGFRKVEAYQANVDDYDEAGFINVNAGTVQTESIINNAATVTTNSTSSWADAAKKSLMVKVSIAGVISYWISTDVAFDAYGNYTEPTWTQLNSSLTVAFDADEQITPFIYSLQAADIMGVCTIRAIEWGLS